jgi:osmoprotectant transport system ATP-binding protein
MQAEVAQYDTPDAILTRPASDYVAEFLGRERLVRRMSVVTIDVRTLEHPAGGPAGDEPRVPVTSALTEAFAAALRSPDEKAAVFDGDRYVGSFTANSLLETLRGAGTSADHANDGGPEVAAGS